MKSQRNWKRLILLRPMARKFKFWRRRRSGRRSSGGWCRGHRGVADVRCDKEGDDDPGRRPAPPGGCHAVPQDLLPNQDPSDCHWYGLDRLGDLGFAGLKWGFRSREQLRWNSSLDSCELNSNPINPQKFYFKMPRQKEIHFVREVVYCRFDPSNQQPIK